MCPLPLVCGNETVGLYKVKFFKRGLNKISTQYLLINTNEERDFVKIDFFKVQWQKYRRKYITFNFSTRKSNWADINSNYGGEGLMQVQYSYTKCMLPYTSGTVVVYTRSGTPPSTIWKDTLERFKLLLCIRAVEI